MTRPIIGIIGLGAIGSMFVKASRTFDQETPPFIASSRSGASVDVLATAYPDIKAATNAGVAREADILFLCVPPSAYLAVLDEIAGELTAGKILVSVTNGVELSSIESRVACSVIKVIPSVVHAVGRGVSLLVRGARSGDAEVEAVSRFIRPFGKLVEVDPADMRIAANLTGCGPALIACFCQVLARVCGRSAIRLSYPQMDELIRETLIATGILVEKGMQCPAIMAEAATGGGMTQIALETLMADLPDVLERMTEAISDREQELRSQAG
jgi:competence protein ComER